MARDKTAADAVAAALAAEMGRDPIALPAACLTLFLAEHRAALARVERLEAEAAVWNDEHGRHERIIVLCIAEAAQHDESGACARKMRAAIEAICVTPAPGHRK